MRTLILTDGVNERRYDVDPEVGPVPQGSAERLLVDLVAFLQPAVVVEVGTLYAQTAVCLAAALPPSGVLYTIERHPLPSLWEVVDYWTPHIPAMREGRFHVMIGPSAEVIPQLPDGIGVAYVDGDHRYPAVKADGDLLWEKLAEGGILAFDDVMGTSEAVQGGPAIYLRERFPHAVVLPACRGLALVQRPLSALRMDDGRLWPWRLG
jgi:predicted O-methyltransferase YrrM